MLILRADTNNFFQSAQYTQASSFSRLNHSKDLRQQFIPNVGIYSMLAMLFVCEQRMVFSYLFFSIEFPSTFGRRFDEMRMIVVFKFLFNFY